MSATQLLCRLPSEVDSPSEIDSPTLDRADLGALGLLLAAPDVAWPASRRTIYQHCR